MTVALATPTVNAFPNGVDNTQKMTIVYGTIAIGANPLTYAAGGVVLSFSGIEQIKSSQTPVIVYIESVSGSGYTYCWNKATGKLQIFTGGAAQSPLTEFTAGVVPAGVSGDTIAFEAHFLKNI